MLTAHNILGDLSEGSSDALEFDDMPGKPVLRNTGNPKVMATKKGHTADKAFPHSCNSKNNTDASGAVAQDKEDLSDNRYPESQQESQITTGALNRSLQGTLGMHTHNRFACVYVHYTSILLCLLVVY